MIKLESRHWVFLGLFLVVGITMGLGVIRPECNIHGKNEFAYLQDIEDLAKMIAKFLLS